jgi:hypothetical protein
MEHQDQHQEDILLVVEQVELIVVQPNQVGQVVEDQVEHLGVHLLQEQLIQVEVVGVVEAHQLLEPLEDQE